MSHYTEDETKALKAVFGPELPALPRNEMGARARVTLDALREREPEKDFLWKMVARDLDVLLMTPRVLQ
ncbi:hypothetical protein F6X40_10200 [Paraburkholderia sp. UCT31]|uniref:hypothetical protein n=1 Tax=Paraburkholderia sp. UCT31 TaxID=2615209 RepID=UPI001654D877|nr:hypothetical protein [Paraburkholderia sp. UCT31]MBC8737179.1 hypothetical protein [Paraburkholderia sp. UCT31]